MSRIAAAPNTGMSKRSKDLVSWVAVAPPMSSTYERYPSTCYLCLPCFERSELASLSVPDVINAREEAIVDETCDLFEVGDYCLGKAFIVADLVEEVVTADNNNFSPYISSIASRTGT